MTVTILVMLWAPPGREQLLIDYEDRVLSRLAEYQARIVTRVRPVAGEPTEVQILEFASEAALEAFQTDPTRLALADLRARAIERTESVRVQTISER